MTVSKRSVVSMDLEVGVGEVVRKSNAGPHGTWCLSETTPVESCSGVEWPAGIGKAQVTTSTIARATAPYWLTGRCLVETPHALFVGLTYTLLVICSRPFSCLYFRNQSPASAAARHVYEPEQTEDQDEDGDCEENGPRHHNLVTTNDLCNTIAARPTD
jgi:hypothetical protein